MAVEERERRELQEALMGAIGSDHTDTLMSYLPPVGWADVATKRDLDALGNQLRAEAADLRSELRGEIIGVRVEMAELGSQLRSEMADLRGELRGEMGALRADLHRELRLQLYALVTLLVALSGLFVTLDVVGA